ncbi:GNAT family N-acetyltransferase [Occallatibacter savannae]|uniref:GNAT family N-acetyltransferase n=1 Tax=Occallatibacter savannae TaxID=1002691 RepID=UPI000D6928F9|nr:GNAT family N-acetyltransferase [Occallatibacter savannae]
MIEIKRITPETAFVFKEARLRALADSPTAFSSTYARESQFPDEEWRRRAERCSDDGKDAMFMAFEGGAVCGIAGTLRDTQIAGRAQLVSMWVDPAYRRAGVGRMLVHAVVEWNRDRDVREIVLMVTDVNEGAIAFYERLGFVKTGLTEQYPNDTAIVEHEMMLRIPLIAG